MEELKLEKPTAFENLLIEEINVWNDYQYKKNKWQIMKIDTSKKPPEHKSKG